jgi:hypothetical protein
LTGYREPDFGGQGPVLWDWLPGPLAAVRVESMTKRMGDPDFKAAQEREVHVSHVAAINALVQRLREAEPPAGRGWVPYIAPLHGGSEAPVLSILRDPGPRTHATTGSGMLCVENDDESAALQCELLDAAGLTPMDLTPWNAYPWYRHDQTSGLTSRQISEGIEPLRQLISLMPALRVVLLQGGEAQTLWRRFTRQHSDIGGRYTAVATYHPGRTALRHPDPAERARRSARRVQAFHEVAALLKA